MVYGAGLLPAGLLVYGWTAEKHVFWLVPVLGTVMVGTGAVLAMMSGLLYLVEVDEGYSASALAAGALLRGFGGAGMPLGGVKLFEDLGGG